MVAWLLVSFLSFPFSFYLLFCIPLFWFKLIIVVNMVVLHDSFV